MSGTPGNMRIGTAAPDTKGFDAVVWYSEEDAAVNKSKRQRGLIRQRSSAGKTRLWLESLENRTLLSVDVSQVFEGLSNSDDPRYEPPDTIAAAGPNQIVEVVNGSVGYYDKATGVRTSLIKLEPFFAPLGGEAIVNDPTVAYDSITGQFLVGSLDYNFSNLSRFDLAVSNDSDPNDGWSYARYDMNDGVGGFAFADQPKLGFNADGYFVSFNMFSAMNHVDVLSIDQTSMTGYRYVVPGGTSHFSMVPATENNASPGDAEYFVEASYNTPSTIVKVDHMYNPFSDMPDLTTKSITVDTYSNPQPAGQPGGSINTDDHRIESVSMTDGLLVASHTVKSGSEAHARWYEFDIGIDDPTLIQSGEVDQGAGVSTYYPSIEINNEHDLGMTFMESSSTEYMSMYVTGQNANDFGSGMQPPDVTHAGVDRYTGGRAGDFSGITVDPADGITFWAANEYRGNAFWNTGIASFTVSPASGGNHAAWGIGPADSTVLAPPVSDSTATSTARPDVLIDGGFVASPPQVPEAIPTMVRHAACAADNSEVLGFDSWLSD
jgi:hypothetical protein